MFFQPASIKRLPVAESPKKRHLLPRVWFERALEEYLAGRYDMAVGLSRQSVEAAIVQTGHVMGIHGPPETVLVRLGESGGILHDYNLLVSISDMCRGSCDELTARRALYTADLFIKHMDWRKRDHFVGLLRRLGAFLVDSIFVVPVSLLISFQILGHAGVFTDSFLEFLFMYLTVLGVWWAVQTTYFTLFEWLWGATPGKKLLGIKVVSEDLGRCDFMRAFTRNVFRMLDVLLLTDVFTILFFVIFYTRSTMKQRLGDYFAGTVVV